MLQARLMWIAWPAFLVACLLEILVFGVVDPQSLQWMGQPLEWSREAVYSVAFFLFWCVSALASGLTTMLAQSPFEVNRCPVEPWQRPESCRRKDGDCAP